MALDWLPVVARMAIPIVVTTLLLNNLTLKEFYIYSRVLRTSDAVLSVAKGEGATNEAFDYIIIGAGSAGAVLAKRLTESGEFSVLVLDRGGDPNPVSDIPFAHGVVRQSDMMAQYRSTPQLRACLANKGNCQFQRGIALGGGSSVNGLVYNRCNVKDYDQWANFTGDPIWSGESVTVAFKDIESYHGWYEDNAGLTHGTKGEMYVERMLFLPGADLFYEAVKENGYPIQDVNSLVDQRGFAKMDYNMKHGIRWGTYHAFLEPILGRPNLKIYRYSWVTQIHFQSTSSTKKRATGVTYKRHGKMHTVSANKEVILSAGSIDSPKLLMLSGIGPKTHLQLLGIPVVLDQPMVGANLQDHIGTYIPHLVLNTTYGQANYATAANILQFVNNASGPYQWISYYSPFAPRLGMGYISSYARKDKTYPDLQIYIHEQVIQNKETIMFEVAQSKPEQTGTVRLSSKNPEADPFINPRIFENRNDLERLIDGIEIMTDFFLKSRTYLSKGIQWLNPNIDPVSRPNLCNLFKFPSRDYWRCYVPIMGNLTWHPTSTCRMGPNSSVAVVDSRLNVFGTTNLRVVDASVMPEVPNGNTNFPSIMVGEMGAKIILNQI